MLNFMDTFGAVHSNNFLRLDNLNVSAINQDIKKEEIMVRIARIKDVIKHFDLDLVRNTVIEKINELYYKNKEMIAESGINNLEFILYTKYSEEIYQNAIIKAFLGIESICGNYDTLTKEGKIYSYSEYSGASSNRDKAFLESTIVLEGIATISFSIVNALSATPDNQMVYIDEKVKTFLNSSLTKEGSNRVANRDYYAGNLVYSELV